MSICHCAKCKHCDSSPSGYRYSTRSQAESQWMDETQACTEEFLFRMKLEVNPFLHNVIELAVIVTAYNDVRSRCPSCSILVPITRTPIRQIAGWWIDFFNAVHAPSEWIYDMSRFLIPQPLERYCNTKREESMYGSTFASRWWRAGVAYAWKVNKQWHNVYEMREFLSAFIPWRTVTFHWENECEERAQSAMTLAFTRSNMLHRTGPTGPCDIQWHNPL